MRYVVSKGFEGAAEDIERWQPLLTFLIQTLTSQAVEWDDGTTPFFGIAAPVNDMTWGTNPSESYNRWTPTGQLVGSVTTNPDNTTTVQNTSGQVVNVNGLVTPVLGNGSITLANVLDHLTVSTTPGNSGVGDYGNLQTLNASSNSTMNAMGNGDVANLGAAGSLLCNFGNNTIINGAVTGNTVVLAGNQTATLNSQRRRPS